MFFSSAKFATNDVEKELTFIFANSSFNSLLALIPHLSLSNIIPTIPLKLFSFILDINDFVFVIPFILTTFISESITSNDKASIILSVI